MRVLAMCILALGLAVSPAMAGTGSGGGNDPAGGGAANAATATNSSAAPTAPKAEAAQPAPSSSELESELQQLRDLLESQAQQLKEQQQKMELLEEQLSASNSARENLAEPVGAATTAAIGPAIPLPSSAGQDKTPETPNSISVKGITLTPGGFMAAETVWREHALSGDVNTAFNAIPFSGSPLGHVSEFNASGRQSRISMLVEGKLSDVKIGGYYETDFLSAAASSNYNQSSSFSLRQRQFWAQAACNSGWTITGGQMWSLVTETKKGLDNRT
jgi:hypothetical protein